MAAHYFPGPTISKRYTTLVDATIRLATVLRFTLIWKVPDEVYGSLRLTTELAEPYEVWGFTQVVEDTRR